MLRSKGILVLIMAASLLLAATAQGMLMEDVEPDDYADGTNISTAFSNVTLTALGIWPDTVPVYSLSSGEASTGERVFGYVGSYGGKLWVDPQARLRVDFALPTDYVTIDICPDDDDEQYRLAAYDSGGNLVDEDSATILNSLDTQASVSSLSYNISYLLVSGINTDSILLDNLSYNTEYDGGNPIPEPATLALLGMGLVALGVKVRRKRR